MFNDVYEIRTAYVLLRNRLTTVYQIIHNLGHSWTSKNNAPLNKTYHVGFSMVDIQTIWLIFLILDLFDFHKIFQVSVLSRKLTNHAIKKWRSVEKSSISLKLKLAIGIVWPKICLRHFQSKVISWLNFCIGDQTSDWVSFISNQTLFARRQVWTILILLVGGPFTSFLYLVFSKLIYHQCLISLHHLVSN